jgi:hypothetical protein
VAGAGRGGSGSCKWRGVGSQRIQYLEPLCLLGNNSGKISEIYPPYRFSCKLRWDHGKYGSLKFLDIHPFPPPSLHPLYALPLSPPSTRFSSFPSSSPIDLPSYSKPLSFSIPNNFLVHRPPPGVQTPTRPRGKSTWHALFGKNNPGR